MQRNAFRAAVLADLHLPDNERTVKESILTWTLDTARQLRVDLIVGAGDLTGIGTVEAARRIRRHLEATGIPFILTSGNAERRSPEEWNQVSTILGTATGYGPVRLIDTATGRIPEADRIRLRNLSGRNLLLVTHTPPSELEPEDRALLEQPAIGGIVAGHCHRDSDDGKIRLLRGLDPDKAMGGPPSFAVFTLDGRGRWSREDIPCPAADPRQWPIAERREWLDHLGLSGMGRALESIREATEHGVTSLELRCETITAPVLPELVRRLDAWRVTAGKHLSIHLPDLAWAGGRPVGLSELRQAADLAIRIGANHATLHVPRIPVGDFDRHRESLLEAAADTLAPLKEAGIIIGIENLHLTAHEQPGPGRRFGYTPEECRNWIELLRGAMDYPEIGLHLDIGHARNNGSYSHHYPVSSWYALLGRSVTGFHLHQACMKPDGTLENHMPLPELFGSLISLSSLFLAWRDRSINHAPMYLEIRTGLGIESLLSLRRELAVVP